MSSPEKAKKWREEHKGYRKEWYAKNKELVRANVKRKYYENVTKENHTRIRELPYQQEG